ncbi:MAG: PAS domain S-box protein [Elusimicrobiaceae bacterium]|nr:PAS domain S-box protein [Elusimicrobiaceae bacterium]
MPKNIFSFFSKQKPADATLKNVPPEMLALLEELPAAVLLVGKTGLISYVNASAASLLQQEKQALVGQDIKQLLRLSEEQFAAWPDNTTKHTTLVDLPKGGEICLQASAKTVWDMPLLMVALEETAPKTVDLTEVSAQSVLDSFPDAITVQDELGRCLFWNAPAQRLFAKGATPAVGKMVYQLFPKTLSAFVYGLDEEFKAGKMRTEPARFTFPEKEEESGGRCIAISKSWVGRSPRMLVTKYEDVTNRVSRQEDLERSQKLLQAILENIPLGIYTRDCDKKVTFINRQGLQILNETPNSLEAKHAYQAQEEADGYTDREKQILREGKICEYPEEVYVDSSGKKRIVHAIKAPLFDVGPKPLVLTIVEDITKRHEQEQEIRRANGFLSAIVQNAPIALYARSQDGRILLRNKQCEKVFGSDDGTGRLEHETDEQVAAYMKRENEILQTGETIDIPEENYVSADGKKKLLHLVKAPVQESHCVVTLVEDITLRKAQERALVESKNFLQTVVDQLPVSLSVKNYEGKYILWNKKSEELFGAAAGDVIGKSAYRSDLNKEQAEFIRETDLRVFENKKEQDIPQELISSAKDGIKIMHTVKTPVFNEDGTPNCLLMVSEDITAKTKMEKQIREASDKNTLLVENAREGVVMVEDGKIIYANHAFCEMLGVETLEEIKGKTLLEFSTENHRVFLKEKYEAVRSGADDGKDAIEAHFLRKDGTKLEAKFVAMLAKYMGRRIVLGFANDITAENRVLRDLKNERDNFRRAFESSVLPAFILSPRGYISLMNESCRQLLGFTQADKKFYRNVYVRPGIALPVRRAMKEGKSAQLDYILDFDKLAQKFPGRINKTGLLELSVSFVPLSKRDAKDGSVEAEYMVSLQSKDAAMQKPVTELPPPAEQKQESQEEIRFAKTAQASESLPPLPPFLAATQSGRQVDRVVLPNSEPYALCDDNFFIMECNELFCSLCGLQKDELTGQDIRHLFHPDEKPLVEQDFELLKKEGKLSNREYTINLGSSLETCKVRLMAVKEEEHGGFLFVLHSLAFHTQIMKILEERSAQYSALSSATNGAVLRVGFDNEKLGPIEQLNNWLSNKTGYLHEELAQKSLGDLFVEPEPEQPTLALTLSKAAKQLAYTGKTSFILPLRKKDGSVFQAQVTLSTMDIPMQQDALAVVTDLTAQQESLGQISREAQELSGLRQNLPGLYLRVDEKGTVLEVSSNLPGLDNAQVQQFLGKTPDAFWPQEAANQALFMIKEALGVHVTSNFSFEWPRENQSRYYEADVIPLGSTPQAILWVKDASEKRIYDSRLHELYHMFEQTELTITEQVDRILEMGKQFFQAQVGFVLRFQERKSRLESVVLYTSENAFSIERHMEFPVEECLRDVLDGSLTLLPDLEGLSCKQCMHKEKKLKSLVAAPLVVDGKIEGSLCFASTVARGKFDAGAEELLGLMARLLALRIEIRQADKMLGAASRVFTRTLDDVQLPALRLGLDFTVTYVNDAFTQWTGRTKSSLLGRDLFQEISRYGESARRALQELSQKSSGFDSFEIKLDILLPTGLYQETKWNVFVCKDTAGKDDGYVLIIKPGH